MKKKNSTVLIEGSDRPEIRCVPHGSKAENKLKKLEGGSDIDKVWKMTVYKSGLVTLNNRPLTRAPTTEEQQHYWKLEELELNNFIEEENIEEDEDE